MYRHCIYCSAALGANEALEAFPVGRTLAFDAARGRLWAVCGGCGRWNLAPIEERWEAVDAAERLFRDTRLRAQSENIGVARLSDGTRLIRVGAALAGEVAAWRYGDQLMKRRRRHLLSGRAATAAGLVGFASFAYAATGLGSFWISRSAERSAWGWYRGSRLLQTLAPGETPDGSVLQLRRKHLLRATLHRAAEGGIELRLPHAPESRPPFPHVRPFGAGLVLADPIARRVLERGMVHLNAAGAKSWQLDQALRRIGAAGSAEEYILATASYRLILEGGVGMRMMTEDTALALEIALHEEQERRALAGELSILEAAWRDAEPIAEIADRLALEPGTTQ